MISRLCSPDEIVKQIKERVDHVHGSAATGQNVGLNVNGPTVTPSHSSGPPVEESVGEADNNVHESSAGETGLVHTQAGIMAVE